jgi:hypothetical protein
MIQWLNECVATTMGLSTQALGHNVVGSWRITNANQYAATNVGLSGA